MELALAWPSPSLNPSLVCVCGGVLRPMRGVGYITSEWGVSKLITSGWGVSRPGRCVGCKLLPGEGLSRPGRSAGG